MTSPAFSCRRLGHQPSHTGSPWRRGRQRARKPAGARVRWNRRGRFAAVSRQSAGRQLDGPSGSVPAVLCGTVGSSFGWRETPYLPRPLTCTNLPATALWCATTCASCRGCAVHEPAGRAGRHAWRGNATAGCAGALDAAMGRGGQLVCMPGTHTKWVSMNGSRMQVFLTAPTGELLRGAPRSQRPGARPGNSRHRRSLAISNVVSRWQMEHAGVPLLHKLFQCRSLQPRQTTRSAKRPSCGCPDSW